MIDEAGQPDEYYHLRIFTEGSITRQEALKYLHDNPANMEDVFGICWLNERGLMQYLHFREMTETEQDFINCPLDKRYMF